MKLVYNSECAEYLFRVQSWVTSRTINFTVKIGSQKPKIPITMLVHRTTVFNTSSIMKLRVIHLLIYVGSYTFKIWCIPRVS